MGVRQIIKVESDTIVGKSVSIPFEFNNRKSLPKGKDPGNSIVIRPLTVRTWFTIRPLLIQIDKEDFAKLVSKDDEVNSDLPGLMDKYAELLLDIVCLGIHNKPSEPPVWFREVLMDNSTWEDIRILVNAIIYRIGFFPFCNSITTLQSVSPWTETEMIAARRNLTSWQDTAKGDT
ncbi:hypothetical protein [Bacteroides neonati]|uniref:hypothetical protein n=1 Tax=Bacteroides neonati TaxID=1347393 RepID=UPI0004B50C9F|nr:hypothetical protein [Bacteroides neonati]